VFIDERNLKIFIYSEEIDMRGGFERLMYFVRERLHHDLDQGYLYLFFGKNRKRLKALYYDGSGLVLVSKRLESGVFMSGNSLLDLKEISSKEFQSLFHGGRIVRPQLKRDLTLQVA
jgi:transposase